MYRVDPPRCRDSSRWLRLAAKWARERDGGDGGNRGAILCLSLRLSLVYVPEPAPVPELLCLCLACHACIPKGTRTRQLDLPTTPSPPACSLHLRAQESIWTTNRPLSPCPKQEANLPASSSPRRMHHAMAVGAD